MDKKLFTIFFIAVLLIAAASFVSASDDTDTQDIYVKLIWSDAKDLPSQVTVNLIHDGKVINSTKLSESNSWKTTFKNQEKTGSYSVQVNNTPNSFDIKGNAKDGFVINNKVIEESVLGASDEDIVEEPDLAASNDNIIEESEVNTTPLANNSNNNTNPNGNNDSNTTDVNNTTDSNNTNTRVNTNNTKTTPKTINTNKKTTPEKTVVKKYETTKTVQKNKTNATLKKVGLPIALIVIAIVTIFIPITNFRKK